MRLATIRTESATRAVRVAGDRYAELDAADVTELLADPDWRKVAGKGPASHSLAAAELAPVVSRPGKILCVGLNYRNHILEMGRELPRHPTLFAKYPEALVGPRDPVSLPAESGAMDWEAELAIVIGAPVRWASHQQAAAAIAGFSVLNDVTARDWQYRCTQWLQGKTFEATSPFGPVLVTPDELPGATSPTVEVSCAVDGELMQRASTEELVFGPVELVRYISTILTLRPGDVIASGTPGGVGHAREPARYLADGSVLRTEISSIGKLENKVRRRPSR